MYLWYAPTHAVLDLDQTNLRHGGTRLNKSEPIRGLVSDMRHFSSLLAIKREPVFVPPAPLRVRGLVTALCHFSSVLLSVFVPQAPL